MSDNALFFISTTKFIGANEEETEPNKCKAMNMLLVILDHILDCIYEEILQLDYCILALISG